MTPRAEHIARLIRRDLTGELTPEETGELNAWVALSEEHAALFDEVHDGAALEQMLRQKKEYDKDRMITALREQFPEMTRSDENTPKTAHRIHFLKTAWVRYAAAIIILFGIGAYLWNSQQKEKPLITDSKPVPVKNDVAPGGTKATLTLSDGRKVELTPETRNITEAGINIENSNGRLEYGKAEKVVFNTMTTPRGGQYQLTLPDGTNVWLNAASSITYPTAFVKNNREVSITGEAYFEVKRNPSKPFIVKTPEEDITVLGTSFNVNAYAEEPAMKTSLVEGSVKIENQVLKPGYAYINGKVVTTNTKQDVAWKNGVFDFNNLRGDQVMTQLARWFDVEISYPKTIKTIRFGGEIDRNLTLNDVLTGLEGIGGLKFRLEGRKVIVSH